MTPGGQYIDLNLPPGEFYTIRDLTPVTVSLGIPVGCHIRKLYHSKVILCIKGQMFLPLMLFLYVYYVSASISDKAELKPSFPYGIIITPD